MTLIDEPIAAPRVKRWTKSEYYDLIDRGAFRRQRVFLHRGEIIEMAAMGALHVIGVSNVTEWACRIFSPEFRICTPCPLEVPGQSVPQPDLAIVTHEQMARRPHPNAAVLVVEVSDSSLELDRELALDYAAAGFADYWIVNMRDRQLELFRDPVADEKSVTGFRYASVRTLTAKDFIAPLARPDAVVAVSALVRT